MRTDGAPRAAEYARPGGDESVQCELCDRGCLIVRGGTGFCGGRRNIDGRLVPETYARAASVALDPVEKKPLYHFYPGSTVLSVGTYGCNLNCSFCQNWQISHPEDPGSMQLVDLPPQRAIEMIGEYEYRDCIGAAFTYSEPLVWYEYVLDTSRLLQEEGLRSVLVTNGYLRPEPWNRLLRYIDACNIDVKGFNPAFYRTECAGDLEVVRRNVEAAVDAGVHVEVTTLLVPDGTDDLEEISDLAAWLARLNPELPLHLSRYYPHRRMHRPPTAVETLFAARDAARESLHHVYLGNVMSPEGSDTFCACCGAKLLSRSGLRVRHVSIERGECTTCGHRLNAVLCAD